MGQGVRVGSGVGVDQVVGVGQGVGVKVGVVVGGTFVGVGEGKGVWVAAGELASALASPVKARGVLQPVSRPTKLSAVTADVEPELANRLNLLGLFMIGHLIGLLLS